MSILDLILSEKDKNDKDKDDDDKDDSDNDGMKMPVRNVRTVQQRVSYQDSKSNSLKF